MTYAVKFVLGHKTHTIVVQAADSNEAFDRARSMIRNDFRSVSAAIQGGAYPASQYDIDAAQATLVDFGMACN